MKPIIVSELIANIRTLLASPTPGFVAEQLPYINAFVERIEKHETLMASAVAVAWDKAAWDVGSKNYAANIENINACAERATLDDLMAATVDEDFAARVLDATPQMQTPSRGAPSIGASWWITDASR